jgi:hypothetical protein
MSKSASARPSSAAARGAGAAVVRQSESRGSLPKSVFRRDREQHEARCYADQAYRRSTAAGSTPAKRRITGICAAKSWNA